MNPYTHLAHYSFVSVIVAGIFFCAPFVNAQESAASSSTATSSAATSTVASAEKPRWFTSDFISGDIQVGDFVIGPGKVEMTIKPGQSVTKMISVTNRISDNRTFQLTVEDMSGSANPSEAVVLLGDQSGPYSLRDYFSFPESQFSLKLGERAQIPVTITMPPNAEPGGYYGAVLVSTVQNKDATEDVPVATPVIARVGTLFFITVPGEFEKKGSVVDFTTIPNKWLFTKGPLNLGVLFENTGSIHLGPYGEVSVKNILGEEVGFVEIPPWFVLPKSMRLRELSWDRELLLGRYTITANINRGYEDIVDTKVIHVWVLPWQFILGVFGSLLALFIIFRFIFSRFEFKRKSVR